MKTIWKQLRRFVDGDPSVNGAPNPGDPADPLVLTDPKMIAAFKTLSADLRKERPVCPVASGGVLLLDPEDVRAAFSNPNLSNQPSRFSALAPKNKDKYVAASVAANILPFLDAPRHVALRQWASRAFFGHFKEFEARIEPIARAHCAELAIGQTARLVEDVARNFVVEVIGKFVGLEQTPEAMKQSTSALFRLFAPAADADTFAQTNAGLAQARTQLDQALQARRGDQVECLMTALDASCPSDMSDRERDTLICDTALLFLADGVENVEAAIGVVMMCYAQTPEPITESFVRRAIASDTPGQTIARIASQDISIGSLTVKAGTPVFLSLASANDGSTQDDFTFGRGRHKCIGEHLAVAMVTALCQHLAQRQPKIDASGLTYRGMFGHKWPRGLTITLQA
ncbi:MAG: cytochrome P450 [Paracoccaceae bacterium]